MDFTFLITSLSLLLIFTIDLTSGKDIPSIVVAEEIGFGIQGATHYLKHLLEGCDNVGDLNKWVLFMDSYLSCEDKAWPYQSDEDKLLKTEIELITNFCNAWPQRLKCANKLAQRMDLCYGAANENGRKGTYSLKFSNAYANLICENKNEYLASLNESKEIPADRRSLNCYAENKERIEECTRQRGLLIQRNDPCSSLEILEGCFKSHLGPNSCKSHSPLSWIVKVNERIKSEFHC